jgi:hypothetical protein
MCNVCAKSKYDVIKCVGGGPSSCDDGMRRGESLVNIVFVASACRFAPAYPLYRKWRPWQWQGCDLGLWGMKTMPVLR